MSKVYVGDRGTVITLNTGADLSTATAAVIKVKLPDATETTWTGAVYDTYYVKYTIGSTDLTQHGKYYLQALVTLPSGTWSGETVLLTVYDEYK